MIIFKCLERHFLPVRFSLTTIKGALQNHLLRPYAHGSDRRVLLSDLPAGSERGEEARLSR